MAREKKRRRSNRKPQREQSPSLVSKLTSMAKVTLAAGAGVALFNSSKIGRTLKREIIPAIGDTIETYNKSLAGSRKKAIDIHEAFEKAIGKKGSAFRETLERRRVSNAHNLRDPLTGRGKYKVRLGDDRNLFGFTQNLEQVVKSRGYKAANKDAIKTLELDRIKELSKKYEQYGYDKGVIEAIVSSAISKRDEIEALRTPEGVSVEFLKNTLAKYNVNEDHAKDMIENTLEYIAFSEVGAKSANRKLFEPLLENIKEKRWELKREDTRDNLMLNKIGKKLGIKDLEQKFLGSRAMTLNELLDNEDILDIKASDDLTRIIKNATNNKNEKFNSLHELKTLIQDDPDLGNLIVDRNLRVRTNKAGEIVEIFDNTAFNNVLENIKNQINATLPGKVLTKGIDFKNFRDSPDIVFYQKGAKSILSQFNEDTNSELSKNRQLEELKVSMRTGMFTHTLYSVNRNVSTNELELGEALGKGFAFSNTHGVVPRIVQNWLGQNRRDNLASDGVLSQLLDINQSGRQNIFKRIQNHFLKFTDEDWERNIFNRKEESFLSGRRILEEIQFYENNLGLTRGGVAQRLHADNQAVLEGFEKLAAQNAIEKESIMALIKVMESDDFEVDDELIKSKDKVLELLKLTLNTDTEDVLNQLSQGMKTYSTSGLNQLIQQYHDDAPALLKRVNIQSTVSKKIPILDIELAETHIMFTGGEVRQAILKELMSEGEIMSEVLSQVDLDSQQLKAFNIMSLWQKFEKAAGGKNDFGPKSFRLLDQSGDYDNLLREIADDSDLQNAYSSAFREMKSEYGLFHKGVDGNPNEKYYSEYNMYDFIPTTKLSMSKGIVENANQFIKELNGGRDHLDQISPITIAAQYMVSRLSYGVDDSGFGLSYNSLTSPLNSVKNIFTKRILPVMAAYTAFDYLNDLSQDITGVGITGAAANSLRNLDLLGRGVAYNTGLGQALDWLKQTSVIGEYWTGSTDFQNVEERKDWYENGYSPVRKSRFWSFGSASEFRGGDITFFQPNYWRRVHSDYHDKWLYGGNKEKWKHSIIPTPTHPLSTIRYLMDPYWLEKKHMDDAPTPLTGKMFSEGTPWGAVLNPTIGQVIKPVRMLPEVRRRLTGKGRDAKSIIKDLNEKRKMKADRKDGASNKDLLVINGTDIRNATYVPYGNPTENELIITNGRAKGIHYMDQLSDVSAYRVPTYDPYADESSSGGNYYGPVVEGSGGGTKSRFKIVNQIGHGIDVFDEEVKKTSGMATGIIESINNAMKNASNKRGFFRPQIGLPSVVPPNSSSPDSSDEGTYYYNNMVNEYNTKMATYYDEKYMASFINRGLGSQTVDYMQDIKYSAKQLSGIYGFLADVISGGPETTYRWENAGSYQSFSTRFWDAGVGGLGGGLMEIARRFFPSSDKSRVDYNPLRNNVADWLPDYLQVGNPFSKLTKGEMRLPGKGYESLNELHPDEFATDGYGAFDRFKILADVAPNSKEYKIWHNIVKHQTLVHNPQLKQEFEEIESRTKRMRGSHEFYNYQYLHTNTSYKTGVVKEVKENGQIVLGNDQILTLAGINFNSNYAGELGDFITPGKKISYRVSNSVTEDEQQGIIRNAAVYVKGDTTSINKQLMDMGVADRDKLDTSSIGQLATVSTNQELLGGIQEIIAHARIPIIHNKLLHIESPLESFESEQIYGANFQTWDHPIEGFVKPMLNETMGQSMLRRMVAVGYGRFHFNTVLKSANVNKLGKFASGMVMATLDPSAMLGGGLNFALRLNNGRVGRGDKALGAFSAGAKAGSAIGTMAWGIANADNPLKATASFAVAGIDIFKNFELGEYFFEKFGKEINWKHAGTVGAAVGLTLSAIKNPDFDWDRMTKPWKPKKYEKINEINEYFDRLEYIKYKGLYEAAARKAALLEDAPIKQIFKDLDKNKERITELRKKQDKLLKKHGENSATYKAKRAEIQQEIDALTQKGNQMFTGGKYTKAAVAYKKAMESTIYGLSEGATKDEILAAVPDQYKDYFQAFMEETDEGERKKILKRLPDYLKRPLQAAWGEELEDVKSNRRYFRSNKLPNIGWRGWKPNVNLKHVKMKTIENEGMLLSDFGYYESEKAKPQYMMAPEIENYDRGGGLGISTYTKLAAELKGMGVSMSNISLEHTSTPGFWMTADIKQSINDRTELATNSMTNAIQGIVANFI